MHKNNSKQDILNCAKQEFLNHGFKDASLRKIVKMAGVTTGAFYAHFTDKEELFKELIQPAVDRLTILYEHTSMTYEDLIDEPTKLQNLIWEQSKQRMTKHIDDIFLSYSAFKLLLLCSEGTRYENFFCEMIENSVKETERYFDFLRQEGISINRINRKELSILIHYHFFSVYEIIKFDMTKEEAYAYVDTISDFFAAGWKKVLNFS